MRRWRKRDSDDDVLSFDSEDVYSHVSRNRYSKPVKSKLQEKDDEDDEDIESDYDCDSSDDDDIDTFDRLEPLVRSGKYKPKQSDPYTIHLLYQTLIDFGEIK